MKHGAAHSEPLPRFRSLNGLFGAMSKCTRCPLALGRTHVVPGVGNGAAGLMLIGEAPGQKEDLAGEPFVGRAGALLTKVMETAGLSRDDVFITNIVACRPPANRTPRTSEVHAHAPWIDRQLQLVRPVLVVTLGRSALTYFLPKAKVGEMRGKPQKLEREEGHLTLFPSLHPAAVLRDPDLRPTIESDFRKIAKLLKRLA